MSSAAMMRADNVIADRDLVPIFRVWRSEAFSGTSSGTMALAGGSEEATAGVDGTDAPILSWLRELRLEGGGEVVRLRSPLRVNIARDPDDDGYIVSAPLLASAGSGPTQEAALRDLAASILGLHDDLISELEEALAPDAIKVKARLSSLLER